MRCHCLWPHGESSVGPTDRNRSAPTHPHEPGTEPEQHGIIMTVNIHIMTVDLDIMKVYIHIMTVDLDIMTVDIHIMTVYISLGR